MTLEPPARRGPGNLTDYSTSLGHSAGPASLPSRGGLAIATNTSQHPAATTSPALLLCWAATLNTWRETRQRKLLEPERYKVVQLYMDSPTLTVQ